MYLVYGLCLVSVLLVTGCSTTTIYVVRHAEKVNESDTTNLSAVGYARAADLANTLANRHIDSIFTTPYRRTRQTAQPLAIQLGVPITDYPAKPVQTIINRLQSMRRNTVLVVGHSNTILDIVKGLGATPSQTQIEASDFDNLFQLKLRRGPFGRSVRFLPTTYGKPTPP